MFWADKVAIDVEQSRGKGGRLIVRDEKTASGRVHIGSMRGVAVHGLVARVLNDRGIPMDFLYEINDFDPMDGIPSDLDEEKWQKYLGMPLNKVPSPDGVAANFAEYYASEFIDVIKEAGFNPQFYRGSELYLSGKMNDVIRVALDKAAEIRRIYREVSGSKKDDNWLPISIMCTKCGKIGTTLSHGFDGMYVYYKCIAGAGGAKGCGHEGQASPFDGGAKLPWKVEWPAKWKVLDVSVEGAGKDHSTRGGARDVANHISREVFEHDPPHDIPYEFFLDHEGKKMSSSKGRGASAREIADNFPAVIFRLALFGKDPAQQFNIDPVGETLAILYDWHDKIAEKFWDGAGDDDSRLFELIYLGHAPTRHYLPRFLTVAFVIQMEHLSLEREFAEMKGDTLTDEELSDLKERVKFAAKWLTRYAPEKYKFILSADVVPEPARNFSELQKDALRRVLSFAEDHKHLNGQAFHSALHDIRKKTNIAASDFFGALYISFLGRDSGPQAGWFLATLNRSFLLQRLRDVVK